MAAAFIVVGMTAVRRVLAKVVAIAESPFLKAEDRFAQRQVACHREQVGKTGAK
jgi:hypothetical protein